MTVIRVLLDGKDVPGALQLSWTATNHFSPDTFTAAFAMDQAHGLDWWEAQSLPVILDLQVNDGAWRSLGIGMVDTLDGDPVTRRVSVSGRDLSALLQEQAPAQTYQNMTASQIARAIGAAHGFAVDATETAGPVVKTVTSGTDNRRDRDAYEGRFQRETHTVEVLPEGTRAANEWELLVRLAQVHQFDLYMTGRTLHFHPLPKLTDIPVVRKFRRGTVIEADIIEPRFSRRLQIAKPVTVRVRSFSAASGQSVKAEAKSTGGKTGGQVAGSVFASNSGKPKIYEFVRPNLTRAQAQDFADAMLADITRHERDVTWREPIKPGLSPRNVVRIEGSGTRFDQVYYVETVTTSVSFDEGGRLDVTAKSHSAGVQFAGA